MTLQFYSEDVACDDIFFVNEKTATSRFMKWIASRRRDVLHVVYVHKLDFDLTGFFWDCREKLIGPGNSFDFNISKFRVHGAYGTPTFCTISNGHDLTVMLVDSMSYFRESLANAGNRVCPNLPKLSRPAGLGEKLFTSRDTEFMEYAQRDAVVAYHLGKAIEAMHQKYDVAQCVSVADMAAKIFRKQLTYTIPQPSRDIVSASLLAYHGGKNNVVGDNGNMRFFEGVSSIDISSAYPDAMYHMPAFSNDKLYKRFRGKDVSRVPEYGVYCVSGKVAPDLWPVVFSHGFKPLDGEIDRVWIQGFEVNEALRSKRLKITKITGFYYDHERDKQASALKQFVHNFYTLKNNEKVPVVREMYKLILNSISGKFIQTRKRGTCAYTDIDAGVTVSASDLIAGGLFHPFIAAGITAHTRSRIHRIEQHYSAFHTATDGVFTQNPVALARPNQRGYADRRSAAFDLLPRENGGLGSLTLEAKNARLLLVRNKCYILYVDKPEYKPNGELKTPKSKHNPKLYIKKYALHGFQSNVFELEKMAMTNRRWYWINTPNKLKSSLQRGLVPNQFVKRKCKLNVGPLEISAEA